MEKDFPSDYQKGLNALQDIVQVAGADVGPIAAHALYHFSKLRRDSLDLKAALPSLQAFLEGGVRELVLGHLLAKFPGNQVNLCTRPGPATLAEWDRLLDCLPALLELRSFFVPSGPLTVELSPGRVVLKGNVGLDDAAKGHRARAYQLYRKLFSKRVLACYRLGSAPGKGECSLEISADLGDDLNSCYAVDMGNGTFLALPSSFSRYVATDASDIAHGPCLEITDRFALINHRRFPLSNWEADGPREVLHFPFLFRPISLIIPYKGKLIPHPAADGDEYTGSGNSRARIKLHQLDFFSFFCS